MTKPKTKGQYKVVRDKDGMTPRQRLDTRKAELAEIELAEKRGQLIPRAQVEASDQEAAEIIRMDLGYGLPSALASRLAGQAYTASEVRGIVMDEVRAMVARWHRGGSVVAEAVPP